MRTAGEPLAQRARAAAPGSLQLTTARPEARGKFLYRGSEKLYVKGVTYGTFAPDEDGQDFHEPDVVAADFAAMAAHGVNAVRTYTVPPRWLLDLAARARSVRHGRACRGSSTSPSSTTAPAPARSSAARARGRRALRGPSGGARLRGRATRSPRRSCAGTADSGSSASSSGSTTRRRSVDPGGARHLRQLPVDRVPRAPVPRPRAPSTSTSRIEERLDALPGAAAEPRRRPAAVLAEIGLDSRRNGEERQARGARLAGADRVRSRAAPARSSSRGPTSGIAAATTIEDWDFGLTDRDRAARSRRSQPSRGAFAEVPFARRSRLAAHLGRRLHLQRVAHADGHAARACSTLDYPDFEVIVVDDGSTDATGDIARGVRLRRDHAPRTRA